MVEQKFTIVKEKEKVLAEPFLGIFQSLEIAEWAFDCMKDLSDKLGVITETDERIALIYRKDKKGIHFNFSNWLLLGFYGGKNKLVVRIPILKEKLASLNTKVDYKVEYEFKTEPKIVSVSFSLSSLEQIGNEILDLYDLTIDQIGQIFKSRKKSPMRHKHNTQLGKALFDQTDRDSLFFEGLHTE
ncbi:hypothetical protein [Thermoflavimicrobium daqui]|uniref:Uncharacterized protein n=1 Tax=Thermoflavimicrobium daqui TaxID=2137476 RepID=A0A364K8I5_9BACL|nr:hypothetical protein [Thermoflavimicrobium daqui]RAL26607.1 hypothetical protein DL897_00720 [Thermoflavimicrobium daqui]